MSGSESDRDRETERETERERGGGRERGRWGKAMLADTEIKATVVLFSPSFIARRVRCERLVRT